MDSFVAKADFSVNAYAIGYQGKGNGIAAALFLDCLQGLSEVWMLTLKSDVYRLINSSFPTSVSTADNV